MIRLSLVFFALVAVYLASAADDHDFDDPQCQGSRQSPINIETQQVLPGRGAPLFMEYFNKPVKSISATNNGHSVTFRLNFVDSRPNRLIWNGQETFILDSLHFHWGNLSTGGSEHTINGKRFASEVHLVHYNQKYGSVAASLQHSDGLAVVGVFFQVWNNRLVCQNQKFTRFLSEVREPQQTYLITDRRGVFTIQELIKYPVVDYWNYEGSLTTEPCSEAVKWIVSKRSVKIHPTEIAAMATIVDEHGDAITENYRPTLPLNGRQVYSYSHRLIPTALQILQGILDVIF